MAFRARTRDSTNRGVSHGRPVSVPTDVSLKRERWVWGRRCVTPRQTCPQPKGFGRNLRSKTRWFTGFCNSHQVSHFATFFIDARAEISVAESRSFRLQVETPGRCPCSEASERSSYVCFPWRFLRRGGVVPVSGETTDTDITEQGGIKRVCKAF